jgi:cytochrome c2
MLVYAANPENGKKLFMKKCKSCHRLTEGTKVGPSLVGVTKRRSPEWLDRWLKNPKEMIKAGDPVAVELLKKYKKRMPKYKIMQDKKNRDDVISFLKDF